MYNIHIYIYIYLLMEKHRNISVYIYISLHTSANIHNIGDGICDQDPFQELVYIRRKTHD